MKALNLALCEEPVLIMHWCCDNESFLKLPPHNTVTLSHLKVSLEGGQCFLLWDQTGRPLSAYVIPGQIH